MAKKSSTPNTAAITSVIPEKPSLGAAISDAVKAVGDEKQAVVAWLTEKFGKAEAQEMAAHKNFSQYKSNAKKKIATLASGGSTVRGGRVAELRAGIVVPDGRVVDAIQSAADLMKSAGSADAAIKIIEALKALGHESNG